VAALRPRRCLVTLCVDPTLCVISGYFEFESALQAVVEERQVSVEKPVEFMKPVAIQKPHTVYEEVALQGAATVEKPVMVQVCLH
jgi:hypothetical protein